MVCNLWALDAKFKGDNPARLEQSENIKKYLTVSRAQKSSVEILMLRLTQKVWKFWKLQ